MQCAIYKSGRQRDTYLYVAVKDDFSQVPEVLLVLLGEPIHVMDLDLGPMRKLAQEDVRVVIRSLQEQGWYLQMPRKSNPVPIH